MMGDNDSTDLKVTNSQKTRTKSAQQMCGEKAQTQRGLGKRDQAKREIISSNAHKIPGSNLIIHT